MHVPFSLPSGHRQGRWTPRRKRPPVAPVTSWQGSAARPGLLGGIGQEGRLPYKTRYLSSSKRIRFCPVSGFWWSLRVHILWRWFRMAMIHVGIIIRIVGHNIHHTSKLWSPSIHLNPHVVLWWCFSHLLAPMFRSIRKTSPFQVVAIMLLLSQVKPRHSKSNCGGLWPIKMTRRFSWWTNCTLHKMTWREKISDSFQFNEFPW